MNWHYKAPFREACSKQNENMLYLLWIAAHHYLCLIWTHGPLLPNIAISCIVLSECLQRNNAVPDPLPGRIIPNLRHVAVEWILSRTNTDSTGFYPVVQTVPFSMSISRWCYISSLCLCLKNDSIIYTYLISKASIHSEGLVKNTLKSLKQWLKNTYVTAGKWQTHNPPPHTHTHLCLCIA